MFNDNDFRLHRIDRSNGHEDYWFYTSIDADKKLTQRYAADNCKHVFEVVYHKVTDTVEIKRQIDCEWDMIQSDDEEIRTILQQISDRRG